MLRLNTNIHELKTLDMYFDAIAAGDKPFEVRRHDRDFQVGDFLRLHRTDANGNLTFPPQHADRHITYILEGGRFGIMLGYSVLGLGEFVADPS